MCVSDSFHITKALNLSHHKVFWQELNKQSLFKPLEILEIVDNILGSLNHDGGNCVESFLSSREPAS